MHIAYSMQKLEDLQQMWRKRSFYRKCRSIVRNEGSSLMYGNVINYKIGGINFKTQIYCSSGSKFNLIDEKT